MVTGSVAEPEAQGTLTGTPVLYPADLEPSPVAGGIDATRRLSDRIDAAALLGVMIFLLYVLPAQLIVPDLTIAGRPALLIALALFSWWLLTRLNSRLVPAGPQPMRWAAMAYLTATMLSYLAGLLRGLPSKEANAQNLAVLLVLQFLGVVLIAADGPSSWRRLYTVLRGLVCAAGFLAIVGIVQALLTIDVTRYITLPGFTLEGRLAGFADRGFGQFRVAGTTSHYIEFSAVLAMIVPFAIHLARFSVKRWQRQAFGAVALLLVASVPMAISRTGIVALAAAGVVMLPVWNWRLRYTLFLLGTGVAAALMVLRPGLLGTVKAMFVAAAYDPSIQGRTDDYGIVAHFFAQRPWLGRGPNTLVPELYRGLVLDNQWLYTLVTGGLVGVVAFAALHVTALTLAALALRRSNVPEQRHLCLALMSSQVVSVVVAGTVDSLWFTTFSTTVALLMGVCGAVWRLTHPAQTAWTAAVPVPRD